MMIRLVNFLCVGLLGLTVLANYHVSEQTRVARVELGSVDRKIQQDKSSLSVLETEWERVAGPARIQMLAQSKLGMSDSASLQLSALTLLPRRGESNPLSSAEIRQASVQVPEQPSVPNLTPVSDTRQ
jgi:cell division protein FtsL